MDQTAAPTPQQAKQQQKPNQPAQPGKQQQHVPAKQQVNSRPPEQPKQSVPQPVKQVQADSSTSGGQQDKAVPEEPVISIQSDIPTPPNAISGPMREFGPSISTTTAEFVKPTEAAPEVPQDAKEAGVEVSPNTDQPNISPQVQKLTGLQPVNDAVPVPTAPSDMIELPIPEAEAAQMVKTKNVLDSIRWLATLVVQQAKRAHGQLTGKQYQ